MNSSKKFAESMVAKYGNESFVQNWKKWDLPPDNDARLKGWKFFIEKRHFHYVVDLNVVTEKTFEKAIVWLTKKNMFLSESNVHAAILIVSNDRRLKMQRTQDRMVRMEQISSSIPLVKK